jgi:hypothetical protein
MGGRIDAVETDPKKLMSSQEFIGAIKEEYLRRKSRTGTTTLDQTYYAKTGTKNRSLAERIYNPSKPAEATQSTQSTTGCRNCGFKGHTTDNCRWLGKEKCDKCGWFGTEGHDCQKRVQKRKADKEKWRAAKKAKKEQVNQVVEGEEEAIVFTAEEQAGACNFDTYNSLNAEGNDERLLFYDWLADSATTSHVTNMRDAFATFQPLVKPISGVGNTKTQAEGRGTVKLTTRVDGKEFQLTLEDVLYIPSNPQNLISLGRWDKSGGHYHGGDGKLVMSRKDGETIAMGTRISNQLYKLEEVTTEKRLPNSERANADQYTFASVHPAQDWEVWHRRFGHIAMDSIRTLYDKKLVEGLSVNTASPQYDCKACTQAKQHIEPFPKMVEQRVLTQPGDLTHMDLCGKCSPISIHGNQYFHTFLDDATRRPRVCFLKTKDGATLAVKNYVTNLKTQGKTPKALRFDRGREFVNNDLATWLMAQGIEIQTTAGYSPAQNGAAERLNRTLVELARAMLLARDIPLFLWEYAIRHAAYLRERAETRAKPDTTPYMEWNGIKPDVSHLREFGTPVFILQQGQKEPPKLQPRSKQMLFMGYEEGSKSVFYYNPETRHVLTSRNFKFLSNLPAHPSPPEPIYLPSPACTREGESGDGSKDTLDTLQPTESQINPLKRQHENLPPTDQSISTKTENEPPQRKLRTKAPINYQHLNDPFPDEEEDNETYFTSADLIYQATLGTDDPKTVQDAKSLDDWPEWEKAIKAELKQLEEFRTWTLVECPKGAIPLPNKWVFRKKYNRQGVLLKHKARLVVKGYAQRPGFDYTDTFSPVVRLETIRAILAIVPSKQLKVQQMDVKGAYLNGILKEDVYMRQPEGFGDGTNRVCWLQKTLYGLKQSGREWNKELDQRLKDKGFVNLLSDPCAYIRRDGDLQIITVWVDDLLLFALSTAAMEKLKEELNELFDLTDLGEPSKIVGIEISIADDAVTISQPQYVDSLLRKYKMEDANPVSTPLDPNGKLEPNKEQRKPNRSNDYASLIGSLQFLAIATRPDIAYAVNRLAAYTANPDLQHYGAAKRILRYLKGTKTHGITYRAHTTRHVGPMDSNLVYGFADASYASMEDRKSVSGYVFISNGGAITWGSKKQTTIALSSTEAEYVALSEAAREAMWLRHLYGELGFIQKEPILLLGDNDGSIAMAKNPEFHKRTKHVDIRWHWVRELYNDGLIEILDCRDPQQTADILTKQIPRIKFVQHVRELGMSPV